MHTPAAARAPDSSSEPGERERRGVRERERDTTTDDADFSGKEGLRAIAERKRERSGVGCMCVAVGEK